MDTTRLYDTLFSLFGQQAPWKDVRHLQTLIWMLVGLIQIGLTQLMELV